MHSEGNNMADHSGAVNTEPGLQEVSNPDVLEDMEGVTSLDEARLVFRGLVEKSSAQAQLLSAFKRKVKYQDELLLRLEKKHDCQLKDISRQLLLFEARLRWKQKDVQLMMAEKEGVIREQQRVISCLQRRLPAEGSTGLPVTEGSTGREHVDPSGRRYTLPVIDKVGGDGHQQATTEGAALTLNRGDPDSLNDSDSAIILEESLDSTISIPMIKNPDVKVMRSISDAVECFNLNLRSNSVVSPDAAVECFNLTLRSNSVVSPDAAARDSLERDRDEAGWTQQNSTSRHFCSVRHYNGLLRRPEVLETVYSVEEDNDRDEPDAQSLRTQLEDEHPRRTGRQLKYQYEEVVSDGEYSTDDDSSKVVMLQSRDFEMSLHGSCERLPAACVLQSEEPTQLTYNRVMSNHRSVTKPKDVKYKRINKTKSRSLEELRGRLRSWVDKGGRLSHSEDQSCA